MRAAVLNAFGEPLVVQSLPDPVLGTGEVIVDVVAAGVASYTQGILSGARRYLLEPPVVPGPGGIGRVRAVGSDTTKLKAGDWVFCDPTIRSRDDVLNPDMMLLGWTAVSPAALSLHRYFHNGTYAEQVLLPSENVSPLGEIESGEAGRWCAMSALLVPYGGLRAGHLRPGETLVINGATGGFGSSGVAAAVALGAGTVVATGRNEAALKDLVDRFGPRVRTARMTGNEEEDRRCIAETAKGPVDCVLDLLPREASATQVRAAAMAVRPGGRVVLMGGVGRSREDDLALPYPWFMRNDITVRGKWMYPREAVPEMVRLIRARLIDLSQFAVAEFDLDHANDAVDHAANNAGPFRLTVLRPESRDSPA